MVSSPLIWRGFGFDSSQMDGTYAIIIDYTFPDQDPIVYETTLGNHNIGNIYTKSEIVVVSDTNNDIIRTVYLQRPISGVYTFPSIPTSMNIISAIGQQSNFPQCVAQRLSNCMHLPINARDIDTLFLNEYLPTNIPSLDPSNHPSTSIHPTNVPTINPTYIPSEQPTMLPTLFPSKAATSISTQYRTSNPSIEPTRQPTSKPSIEPTAHPTSQPSIEPTTHPTSNPSIKPTTYPTLSPSIKTTINPTPIPTINPTAYPTAYPTFGPTHTKPSIMIPTAETTMNPSHSPSIITTPTPTDDPTIYSLYPVEVIDIILPPQIPINTATLKPSSVPASSPTDTVIHNTNDPYSIRHNTNIICNEEHLCNHDIICIEKECRIVCNGYNSCKYSNIKGANAQSLSIECIGAYSCAEATVFGGQLLFVQINCIGFESCKEGNFYGNDTNLLSIHCVNVNGSCADMNVYCPFNGKQCVISNDGIEGNDIHRNLNLYAVHAFNDLDVSKYNAELVYDGNTSNMMHCGADYASFCVLNESLYCECEYEYSEEIIDPKIDYIQIAAFVVTSCVVLVITMAFIGFCLFCMSSTLNRDRKECTQSMNRNEESKRLCKIVRSEHLTITSINRKLQSIQEEDTEDSDDSSYDKTHLYPSNNL